MVSEREFRAQLGFKGKIIYHYCSLEALYSIVSSRSFWLTSLESTNDKKELKLGQKILNDLLQEMIYKERNTDMKKFLEKVLNAPTDLEYRKYRYQTSYHYYGASFVEQPDSLTHWERYGNDGYGVSIAFNVWMIQHYFECQGLPDICTTWFWHDKIIYNTDLQKEYLKKYIFSMIYGFSERGDMYNTPNLFNTIYYCALAKAKPMFKHSGFSDENEYRILFEEGQAEAWSDYASKIAPTTDSHELFVNITKHVKDAIKELNLQQIDKLHCIIGKSIRSYYSMNLNRIWGDALIPEIIIGPRCYQNKKELVSFLKANGLDKTKVKISGIPIR